MSLKKEIGFVISSKLMGEADSIITLLCESGLKSKFKLKGIKKSKTRPIISSELGSLISIDYYLHEKSDISNVKEVSLINRFDKLKSNYLGYLLLIYLCELLDSILPESDEHKKAYELFSKGIQTLNEEKIFFYFLPFFKIRLLFILGLISKEMNCSICNISISEVQSASIHFQNLEFICNNCKQNHKNQMKLIFLIEYLFQNRYLNLKNEFMESKSIFELDKIFNDFIKNYLNKELKTSELLYKTIGAENELLN